MLESDSRSMSFDQLMARAAQVAKAQDAAREEKEREKRKEEEKRRRREERELEERKRAVKERALERERIEKRRKALFEQKKIQREQERQRSVEAKTRPKKGPSVARKTVPLASKLPEKTKTAHLSFHEVMSKAKELASKPSPISPRPSTSEKMLPKEAPPKRRPSGPPQDTKHTPGLYLKRRTTAPPKRAESLSGPSQMSARDRVRAMYKTAPQKVIAQQRDRRSVSEIQRDLRREKGIYSDDEDVDKRTDPRLLHNRMSQKRVPADRRRLPSPPRAPRHRDASAEKPVRRMPFARPAHLAQRPMKRYHDDIDDEDEDEDLRSFIVSDEEESGDLDHSTEIARMFRYDRKKYTNETYSDDDMEADASELLREEKRSARLARQEDMEEEKRELERLKRRKFKGKGKA